MDISKEWSGDFLFTSKHKTKPKRRPKVAKGKDKLVKLMAMSAAMGVDLEGMIKTAHETGETVTSDQVPNEKLQKALKDREEALRKAEEKRARKRKKNLANLNK